MKRRTAVLGGVAVAALAAGGGLRRWRANGPAGDAPNAPSADAAVSALWGLRFQQPAGGELALAQWRGTPLLLNFWASWCAPCLREMPLLDAFHKRQQGHGLQIVGLAIDSPTPVREYLQRVPVSFPIGLAGVDGVELTRSLGNPEGGLPFSIVIDRRGAAVQRKLGALDEAMLAEWASKVG